MTRNKSTINYLLCLIYEVVLISQSDLFKSNLSGITKSFCGYLMSLILALWMTYLIQKVSRKLLDGKLNVILLLATTLSVLVPYQEPTSFISNLHIFSAYFSFATVSAITLFLLHELRWQDKKIVLLFNYFLIIHFIIMVLACHFLVINGLMEIIYLSSVIAIYAYLNLVVERLNKI